MKTRMLAIGVLLGASSIGPMNGQPPPPPPDAQIGLLTTVSGTISQFNYNPEGRAEGFVVAPNTLVFLPPDWQCKLR
jgi:hypothetical protein